MKRFLFLSITFFFISTSLWAQCKVKVLNKQCKPKLDPFMYAGSAVNDIVFDAKSKILDLEFTAYSDQDYRLIFCPSESLTEEIKIQVFNKRKNVKSREMIFETTSKQSQTNGFEPPKSGNYYIEYSIPASENKISGCMVLLIGSKDAEPKAKAKSATAAAKK
jgi:hypothetical protein